MLMHVHVGSRAARVCIHLLSGRIKCGDCGGWYGSKVWHSPEKCKRTVWQCNQKYKNEVRCTTPYLDEASVKERFTVAVNQLLAGRDAAIAAYELGMARTLDTTELEAQQHPSGRTDRYVHLPACHAAATFTSVQNGNTHEQGSCIPETSASGR